MELSANPAIRCWNEKVSLFHFVIITIVLFSFIFLYRWLSFRKRKMPFPFMLTLFLILYLLIVIVVSIIRSSVCFHFCAVGAMATCMMMNASGAGGG